MWKDQIGKSIYWRDFPMRRELRGVLIAAFGLVVAAAPGFAHHGFAVEFDKDRCSDLTGLLSALYWENPHAYVDLDVKDESGKITNWGFELGSPNGLMRAGWTRNSMKIGDVVTVEGSRAKDASEHGNARTVALAATGKKLFGASSQVQQ